MKIEVKLDESCEQPRVVIYAKSMTSEVEELLKKLGECEPRLITGYAEEEAELIEQADIMRIYAANGKVFAVTTGGELRLRQRLYELEERLDAKLFVRISNSEIVNLKYVRRFDLSMAGTICVKLKDGSVAYVSRRYVSKIKRILGL